VQFNLQFKNREITHKDEGFRVINKILDCLTEVACVEIAPRLEGYRLICRLEPKINI
jgi:translation initiation factor IF-3